MFSTESVKVVQPHAVESQLRERYRGTVMLMPGRVDSRWSRVLWKPDVGVTTAGAHIGVICVK